MRPTLPYIQQKFDEFNRLCFDGQLPAIPIVLSRARTYLGVCAFKTKRDLLMRKRHYDFRLRISTRFDLPEDVIEDTILHEMIHYHIAYNNLKDTSTHGKLFRQMMNDFNQRFGRHITISRRLTEEQEEEAADRRRKPHVVAVMRFKDGRVGIKCVPQKAERIAVFYRMTKRAPEIASVVFYMTDNAFFNRYPTSIALRVFFIDEAQLNTQLEGAQLLNVP